MKITKVCGVYFSPVKNTRTVARKVVKILAEKFQAEEAYVDFTRPKNRETTYEFDEHTLVVFATPTYAGRIPNKILPFVQTLFTGHQTPAIAMVTFGNRSFDNSLIEVKKELTEHGFIPFAAAAVAAEHAFSNVLGTSRPDEEDWNKINKFIDQAEEKLRNAEAVSDLQIVTSVPGDDPLTKYYTPLGVDGQPVQFLKAKPLTREEDCDHCGACAAACPVSAIDWENECNVPGVCIKCQACVKICHTKAKYFEDEKFLSHVTMLEQNYARRAEPSFFLD